jgi:23S rRNA (cytosine1962-C5)-methyltransferase
LRKVYYYDIIGFVNTAELQVLTPTPATDYELIDSGDEMRLERWGALRLVRPDPQALWKKRLPDHEWQKADGIYTRTGDKGSWVMKPNTPTSWDISYNNLTFVIKPTSFKHTGLFPEQLPHWQWVAAHARAVKRPLSMLNLFAYTGGATLSAAAAGISVCHVDASKKAIAWAKENAEKSGLANAPIRWITDDALTFVQKEIKRGNTYDIIILDPPSFGHGPHDELWKIERDFVPLIETCQKLLSTQPLCVIINGYAAGYSALTLSHNLRAIKAQYGGIIEQGENTLIETGDTGRLVPAGVFARWSVLS